MDRRILCGAMALMGQWGCAALMPRYGMRDIQGHHQVSLELRAGEGDIVLISYYELRQQLNVIPAVLDAAVARRFPFRRVRAGETVRVGLREERILVYLITESGPACLAEDILPIGAQNYVLECR